MKKKPRQTVKRLPLEKVQAAKALEEAYVSEQLAEVARAERERATQKADIVIPVLWAAAAGPFMGIPLPGRFKFYLPSGTV